MRTLVAYAMGFVGQPYIWGGEAPIIGATKGLFGFDCSGFVQELMKSVGIDPQGDQNADAYHRYFKAHGDLCSSRAGALCFYGSDKLVTHVAFAIDEGRMIEAGGGDSSCMSIEAAVNKKAFVRIRPIFARKDIVSIIMPMYPSFVKIS